MIPSQLVNSRCWWPTHLGESSSNPDVYEYAPAAFGASPDEFAHFWTDTLRMDDAFGTWPQLIIPIPGHSVSITYFGEPKHEVTFGISTFGQVHTVAIHGGNFMLPGFRWDEVVGIAHLTSAWEITLLLLLPACDIPLAREKEAQAVILHCLNALGYNGPLIERFATELANGRAQDRTWRYDQTYGWVTEDWRCWRSREPRLARGLHASSDDQFFCMKSLSDYVCPQQHE